MKWVNPQGNRSSVSSVVQLRIWWQTAPNPDSLFRRIVLYGMCFIKLQTSGSDVCHVSEFVYFLFRMNRDHHLRMPREALIVIGDIVREAEDLSEALYNARSKSSRRSKDLGVLIEGASFSLNCFHKGRIKVG